MPELHAEYSPSSLEANEKCAARKRLQDAWIARNGPPPDNAAAAEGTRLHTLAEQLLLHKLNGAPRPHMDAEDYEQVKVYVDFIVDMVRATPDPDTLILPEHKVYIYMDPDTGEQLCWGTSDCCLYFPKSRTAHIVDAKFGRIPVSPDTLQLQAYAYGWLTELEMMYGEGCVLDMGLHIVQPKVED